MAENTETTDKITEGIGWLERLVELVKKTRFIEWIELFTVLTVLGVMILAFSHPEKVLDYFSRAAQEKHTELIEQRRENNGEVQKIADRMLYTFNAKRAILLENHNGASNTSGIPFLRVSATFEALNEGVYPVADQYQGVSISLLPFLQHIYENDYWSGYTESIQDLDRSLSYKMLSNGTEWFAICMIRGVNLPLGFIILSFDDDTIPEDLEELEEAMRKASYETALLLELRSR